MSIIEAEKNDDVSTPAELGIEADIVDSDYKLGNDYVVNHHISFEYSLLVRKPIDGLYIIPSANDPFLWFGIIVIRCGVYTGGIFRFRFYIPKDFPNTKSVPKIQFELNIFHPCIYQKTNIVNLQRFFPDGFKANRHRLYHVLNYLQKMFFMLDVDIPTAANPEAAILWQSDKQQFKKLTSEIVRHCRAIVYDPPNEDDPNAIQFVPWNEEIYGPIRKLMFKTLSKNHFSSKDQASLSAILLQHSIGGSVPIHLPKMRPNKGFSWINTETMRSLTDLSLS
ncbi:AKT-interacting protein [Strongyloides ratti]|uniref:AKT-interacting protein n=1 Tax=Strongyloides ratti TaxID=34506 RepID=A0A090MWI0_STRRB|nr:AKT-interacting protein [Strongyloides ratti]CEF63759.1 AKT-interacting protein [Strongyloides ratti]